MITRHYGQLTLTCDSPSHYIVQGLEQTTLSYQPSVGWVLSMQGRSWTQPSLLKAVELLRRGLSKVQQH